MYATIARLCLSLYASTRRVERLPRIVEVQPWQRAAFVFTADVARAGDYL